MSEHMPADVTEEDLAQYDEWNKEIIEEWAPLMGMEKCLALTRSGSWLQCQLIDEKGWPKENTAQAGELHGNLSFGRDPWEQAVHTNSKCTPHHTPMGDTDVDERRVG